MREKRRKRWLYAMICAAGLLCMPACAQAALAPAVDLESLEEDARQTVDDLLSGSYAAVTEKFDETMAQAVSEETLRRSMEEALGGKTSPGGAASSVSGAHVGNVSLSGQEIAGYYVFSDLEEFEEGYLGFQISYDADGKISGLFMRPVDMEDPDRSAVTLREEASYQEEEAVVQADERYPLKAVLTLPKNVEQPPAVVLVHGSGSSNFDEQINENKPFADLAAGLAERGIAVLRYNKRAFQYPDSAVHLEKVTLRGETLDDVGAAIALLEADGRIDQERIFVLGHSFGGSLVPAIAAEHPELAGVVSMAGSLRPLWEISYDQNQEAIAAMEAGELSEEETDMLEAQKTQLEEQIGILRDSLDEQPDDAVLLGVPAGYWKSIKEYCGMNFIEDVSMPMLILQGDADFQVYPDRDYALWQETLSNRENVTFCLYEGLNHLMMPTSGKRDISEYATPAHVDGQVMDDIAAFINSVSG